MATKNTTPQKSAPTKDKGNKKPANAKLWRQATVRNEYTIVISKDLSKLQGLNYDSPKPLRKSLPKLTLQVTTKHAPNDFFTIDLLFIVSDRVKAILEEFEVNAEYHPVKVVYRSKLYQERSFYYAHLMDHVDCLDWKKSKYKLDDNKYADELSKLVIDEGKAAGHPLFQLARVWKLLRLCSEELAERLQSEKDITGIRFDKPGNFRGMTPK